MIVLKVGFDAKRLYGNFTGLGNYSRTIVRNLQFYYPDHEYVLYTPNIRYSGETNAFKESDSWQTVVYDGSFKSLWRSFSLTKQSIKDGVHIFHGLSNEIPFPKGNGKVKRVVTIHDLIFKRLPDTYPVFDRAMYDIKFRHSCRNADQIIAISESTKSDIVHYYGIDPSRIEVIYQSCNPVYYEPIDRSNNQQVIQKYGLPRDYWLVVGSIAPRKNIGLIIEAYRALPKEVRLPLVVVGRGAKYKKVLQTKIGNLPFSIDVRWVEDLQADLELKAVYQEARALIYPSKFEGFGLPVAEAQLSQTPVITSSVSSMPEAGGAHALFVDPYSMEELSAAMIRIHEDEELRKTMISKGYHWARNSFSPKRLSHQLMECYSRLR